MVKISGKSFKNQEAQFPKFIVFIGQKLIFPHNIIQKLKDGSQIQVYNINNKSVILASLF